MPIVDYCTFWSVWFCGKRSVASILTVFDLLTGEALPICAASPICTIQSQRLFLIFRQLSSF